MTTSTSSTTSSIPARVTRAAAVGVVLAGLAVGGAGAAGAAGDDDDRVIRTGSCSGSADWKLKVKTDDGRLEVEGEIDSNVAGQRWRWTLRHNGSVSDRGVATTTARSGSFEVERKVVDLAGADTLVFRAVRDGQVCRGSLSY